jgi:hypothetical protein
MRTRLPRTAELLSLVRTSSLAKNTFYAYISRQDSHKKAAKLRRSRLHPLVDGWLLVWFCSEAAPDVRWYPWNNTKCAKIQAWRLKRVSKLQPRSQFLQPAALSISRWSRTEEQWAWASRRRRRGECLTELDGGRRRTTPGSWASSHEEAIRSLRFLVALHRWHWQSSWASSPCRCRRSERSLCSLISRPQKSASWPAVEYTLREASCIFFFLNTQKVYAFLY